jgi:hypothetical protein
MSDFRFLLLLDTIQTIENKVIRLLDYKVLSTDGFRMLKNWIYFMNLLLTNNCHDETKKKRIENMSTAQSAIKAKANFFKYQFTSTVKTTISKDEIIKAYKSNTTKLICDEKHSRTGRVYKIHINDKAYALKVPRMTGDKCEEILSELKNEADIYNDL